MSRAAISEGTACPWCDGTCRHSRFASLAVPELGWLWAQLAAAADRRGDTTLASGTATVTAPERDRERSVGRSVLGRARLKPHQRVRVDLGDLTRQCAPVSVGALAAHAVGRPLAPRRAARDQRAAMDAAVLAVVGDSFAADGAIWDECCADRLRTSGALARIGACADPLSVARQALGVVTAVITHRHTQGPDASLDRRRLATSATGDPHALDAGTSVAAFSLAVFVAADMIPKGLRARDAWAHVGVRYDDIVGGLTMVGVAPQGWQIPPGVPVTVPPRILADCSWPPGGGRAYVTENPSVLAAALDTGLPPQVAVICLAGTPAATEVAALGRLADAGWAVLVRADFDDAGLAHVRRVLDAVPSARAWRMGVDDYRAGLAVTSERVALRIGRLGHTNWDRDLATVMADEGVAVYEEALCDDLVCDISSTQS